MTLIKSPHRAKLEEETLDDLMTISLNVKPIKEFNFESAFVAWKMKAKGYFV